MATQVGSIKTHVRHQLIDHLRDWFAARSDRQLSKVLGVDPPTISRIRHGTRPVTAEFILAVHDATDMPIAVIRQMIPAHQS